MSTAATEPKSQEVTRPAKGEILPAISGPRLPYHPLIEERFGIDRASWKALVEAIFPNASSVESVILALSYCRARKLDPFKRNVHIVAIWNKDLGRMVDTIWPGIGELRTTAFRTGEYAGRGETVFGPTITKKVGSVELSFPEWAQVTVYRMVKDQRVAFAGPKVFWLETYATQKRNDDTPNEMWQTRPFGQGDKCAEAAALRAGFPEEIGDYIPDEVQHGKAGTTVEGKAVESLDDLAARLEGPSPPPVAKTAEPEESEEHGKTEETHDRPQFTNTDGQAPSDTTDALAELDTILDAAQQLHRVGKAEEEFLTKTRDEALRAEISKRCDAARIRIKAAAAKGKQQGTLAGAT